MGICDIPKVNKLTGLILMIVNIFFPGRVCIVFVKFRYWYHDWCRY